jgi:hypothetical protein
MKDEEPKPRTTEHKLGSWEEFVERVAFFDSEARKPWDEVWYRGQSCADWRLQTTLERRCSEAHSVASYLTAACEILPAVETFTGNQFPFRSQQDLIMLCTEQPRFDERFRSWATYLAHLRHGGFPSPLLDWTASPYVAAYFAFQNARDERNVSIYAYQEWAGGIKVAGPSEPHIFSLGPNFKTHKRHFRQQSRYTACVQFDLKKGNWLFQPHDSVFLLRDHLKQDLLWKFTIPASERLKVLRFCQQVNLNAFTLFESEEGLLETEAMRVFDLRA